LFTNFASKKPYIGFGFQPQLYLNSDIDDPGPHGYKGGWDDPNLFAEHPQGDTLLTLLNNSIVRLRPRAVRNNVALSTHYAPVQSETDRPQTRLILGQPPETTKYDGDLDQSCYGSLLSNLANVWHGTMSAIPGGLSEHNTFHSHYSGETSPAGVLESIYNYDAGHVFPWYNLNFAAMRLNVDDRLKEPLSQLNGHLWDGVHYSFVLDYGSNIGSRWPTAFADDLLSSFVAQTGGTYSVATYEYPWLDTTPWNIFRTWSNFDWNAHDEQDVLRFRYRYEQVRQRPASPNFRKEDWDVEIEFSTVRGKPNPVLDWTTFGWYFIDPVDTVFLRYKFRPAGNNWAVTQSGAVVDLPARTGTFTYNVDGNHVHQFPMCFTTKPSQDTQDTGDIHLRGFVARNYHVANSLVVKSDLLNITPSSFYSSCNAFEEFSSNLKNNNLQNLAKLPDIAELVPDMKLVFQAIIDLKAGNLMGLVKFGDWVAETWLKYQFGVAPNLRVIGQLNAYDASIMDRIRDLGNSHVDVVRGSFTFELPDGYLPGSGKVVLTTRSRLAIEWCDTSLFKSILGLRSIGLLPDLAGLWDLVPGSFIFSWLFNMSRRYKDLTSEALMLACRMHQSIHSYTIAADIVEDLLDLDSLTLKKDRLKFKVYIRHVSDLVPTLKESRFDFRQPQQSPDKSLVAALLWILFRGE
jgi:hypothetical protein